MGRERDVPGMSRNTAAAETEGGEGGCILIYVTEACRRRYCYAWRVDGGWWMGEGMGIRAGVPPLFLLTYVMSVC